MNYSYVTQLQVEFVRFTFLKWPIRINVLIVRRCYIQSPWQPSWQHPGQLFQTNKTSSLSEWMEERHNCTFNGHWVGVTSQIRSKTRHRAPSSSADTEGFSLLWPPRVRDPPVVLCSMSSPLSIIPFPAISQAVLSIQPWKRPGEKSFKRLCYLPKIWFKHVFPPQVTRLLLRHRLLLLFHFHC